MVRLEAAETGARKAGRAALVAIWVAMREAKTRVAAIATVVKRGEVVVVCWIDGIGMDGLEEEKEREKRRREEGKGRERARAKREKFERS